MRRKAPLKRSGGSICLADHAPASLVSGNRAAAHLHALTFTAVPALSGSLGKGLRKRKLVGGFSAFPSTCSANRQGLFPRWRIEMRCGALAMRSSLLVSGEVRTPRLQELEQPRLASLDAKCDGRLGCDSFSLLIGFHVLFHPFSHCYDPSFSTSDGCNMPPREMRRASWRQDPSSQVE